VNDALRSLDAALAVNERLPLAWNARGVAKAKQGDLAEAVRSWEKAAALDPRQFDALFNLGLVAAQAGHREQARTALRQFVATAPPDRAEDVRKARGVLRELGG
jgi:tetratricopeptide (TPR) repeat protein